MATTQNLTSSGSDPTVFSTLTTTTLNLNSILTAKSTTISSDSDAVDVSATTILNIDSNGGDVTIGGLANGIQFQIIFLYKSDSANNVIIEHNEATGTQKILTPTGADITLSTFGGMMLVYSGSFWFVISC